MNAEIIAVGSELLLGQIVNTNAKFLSENLAPLGISVYHHTVVGDNKERLLACLQAATSRSNFLLITGGLGPTDDDLTKEVIAEFVELPLVVHQPSLDYIEAYFKRINAPMTPNNKKQALVIEGCEVLENEHGMAPGMFFEKNGIHYLILPGPPREMEPMFKNKAKPFLLQSNNSTVIHSKVMNFFGIGEAALEDRLAYLLKNQTNPTIAPLAKDGFVTLRITANASSYEEANELIDQVVSQIRNDLDEYFFGFDDCTLAQALYDQLFTNRLTIASAESLTGGLFASHLTAIAGAGLVFNGGIVCYTNENKQNLLDIDAHLLQTDGAVSAACAKQLALNVANKLDANIGLSFTGIAGPDTVENKSVGTVFISASLNNETLFVKELSLSGTREQIRIRSVYHGIYQLLKHLS